MDAQQLDSLLKTKITRSRSAKRVSFVAVAALCLLLVVGIGAGIYHLVNRENPEAPGESVAAEPDATKLSNDTQQPEPSSAPDSAKTNDIPSSVPDSAETKTDSEPSIPEADELVPNGAQEDGLYTHSLQMVWFEEPLSALPEELTISVSYQDEPVTEFTITPANGWQYTWKDAYSADELVLEGDFPQDIFAVFSVSGQNFTVTGIYSDPLEAEATEASDGQAGQMPQKRELPRTGVIWPVGLFFAGFALVTAGAGKKRAQSSRE